MSREFKREDWLAAKAGGRHVSHQEAAEALDSLDDYARMGTGVDAYGPRGMLERYIAQQAATLRQPAARVDVGMVERACAAGALAHDPKYPWAKFDEEERARSRVFVSAALEAALSAQPAPERQGEAFGYVDPVELRAYTTYGGALGVWKSGAYTATTPIYLHPAAPVGVPDGWKFRAIPGGSDTVEVSGPNGEEWWIASDHRMHSLAKALLAAAPVGVPALTQDQIQRHQIAAGDCPPASMVLLVSSVHRFLAAAPVGVPDGMVLVPREPTEAMLKACDTIIQGYGAKLVYARMTAAAPSAPQGTQQGEGE